MEEWHGVGPIRFGKAFSKWFLVLTAFSSSGPLVLVLVLVLFYSHRSVTSGLITTGHGDGRAVGPRRDPGQTVVGFPLAKLRSIPDRKRSICSLMLRITRC